MDVTELQEGAEPMGLGPKACSKAQIQGCASVILDFLQSKCLFTAERALRSELDVLLKRNVTSDAKLLARNLWYSRLEKLVDGEGIMRTGDISPAEHFGPIATALRRSGDDTPPKSSTPTDWQSVQIRCANGGGSSCGSTPPGGWASKGTKKNPGLGLYELRTPESDEDAATLQRQRGRNAAQSCVVFREGQPMTEEQAKAVETIQMKLLYNPHVRGLEDTPELVLNIDTMIAQRYRVVACIGKGSFSRVFQCFDEKERRMVSVKVLHNDKDCLDQVRNTHARTHARTHTRTRTRTLTRTRAARAHTHNVM